MKLFFLLILIAFGNSFSLDRECIQIKRTGDYECASYLRIHDTIVVMYYNQSKFFNSPFPIKKVYLLDSVVIVDSAILSREIKYRKVSRKYILENVPQKPNDITVGDKTKTDSKLFVLGTVITIGSSANFLILASAGIPIVTILPGTVLGIALGVYLAQP